jgi:hypothetical protein
MVLAAMGLAAFGAAGPARAESPAIDMGSYCATSDDCTTAHDGRRCIPERGSCGCESSDDCDPASQICNQGQKRCVVPECRTDQDCVRNPRGYACDTTFGQCGCTVHDQCPTGFACYQASVCVTPAQCRTDSDCAGSTKGPHCSQTTFQCTCTLGANQECAASTDGAVCVSGSCGCIADDQCPTGRYCEPKQRCVADCQSDLDCAGNSSGLRCSDRGQCSCQTDSDCMPGVCGTDQRCHWDPPPPDPPPPVQTPGIPDPVHGDAGVVNDAGVVHDLAVSADVPVAAEQPPLVAPRSAGCSAGGAAVARSGDAAGLALTAAALLLGGLALGRRGARRPARRS